MVFKNKWNKIHEKNEDDKKSELENRQTHSEI